MIHGCVLHARNACAYAWLHGEVFWMLCYAACALGTTPFLRSHIHEAKNVNAAFLWVASIIGAAVAFGLVMCGWNFIAGRFGPREPQNRPNWVRLLKKIAMRLLDVVGPVLAVLVAHRYKEDTNALDIACFFWGLVACLIQSATKMGGGGTLGNVAGVIIVVFVNIKDVPSKTFILVVVQQVCGAAGDICSYIGKTAQPRA